MRANERVLSVFLQGEADSPQAPMASALPAKAEKAAEQPPCTANSNLSTAGSTSGTPLAASTPLDGTAAGAAGPAGAAGAASRPAVKMEGYLEKRGKMVSTQSTQLHLAASLPTHPQWGLSHDHCLVFGCLFCFENAKCPPFATQNVPSHLRRAFTAQD